MRKDYGPEMQAGLTNPVEARRYDFVTDKNLLQWHQDAEKELVDLGFAEHFPHEISKKLGGGHAEIRLFPGQNDRVINIDEKQINDESVGDRIQTNLDPTLPSSQPASKGSGAHTTGLFGTTAPGEHAGDNPQTTVPLQVIFSSNAEKEENFRVKFSDILGPNCDQPLPLSRGRWGLPLPAGTSAVRESIFCVTHKGGTTRRTFNQYIDNVAKLYPDLADVRGKRILIKTDMGPGRGHKDDLIKWKLRGIYILPGLPNGTAVNQEMDRLFAPLEAGCLAERERILGEKRAQAAMDTTFNATLAKAQRAGRRSDEKLRPKARQLHVGREFTSRILSGVPQCPLKENPWYNAFEKEGAILSGWVKVGFLPASRKDMSDKLVRPVREGTDLATRLQHIATAHQEHIVELARHGYGVVGLAAPVPKLASASTGDPSRLTAAQRKERLLRLSEPGGGGRTAGGMFYSVGGKCLNSGEGYGVLVQLVTAEKKAKASCEAKAAAKMQRYESEAGSIIAAGKPDADLTDGELLTLLKFYLDGKGFSTVGPKPAKLKEYQRLKLLHRPPASSAGFAAPPAVAAQAVAVAAPAPAAPRAVAVQAVAIAAPAPAVAVVVAASAPAAQCARRSSRVAAAASAQAPPINFATLEAAKKGSGKRHSKRKR